MTDEEEEATSTDVPTLATTPQTQKLERDRLYVGRYSPWGKVEDSTELANGIWSITTPGHGGIKLSRWRNTNVHWVWRQWGGWYEEDAMWAVPYLTFPDLLGDDCEMLDAAFKTAWDQYPLDALLAMGDPNNEVRHDCTRHLKPGDLVRWVPKVNACHLPEHDRSRTYSRIDGSGRESFMSTHQFPSMLGTVTGIVLTGVKWQKRAKCITHDVLVLGTVYSIQGEYLALQPEKPLLRKKRMKKGT